MNKYTERQSRDAPDQCLDCGLDADQNQWRGGSSTSGFLASLSSLLECIYLIFRFGLSIRLVFVLGFVLGFGNMRKKSGRRRGWKEDGKEWVLFVLTKNKKEKKDILGLGPKTKGKLGKKKNEGRRKASGNLTL